MNANNFRSTNQEVPICTYCYYQSVFPQSEMSLRLVWFTPFEFNENVSLVRLSFKGNLEGIGMLPKMLPSRKSGISTAAFAIP